MSARFACYDRDMYALDRRASGECRLATKNKTFACSPLSRVTYVFVAKTKLCAMRHSPLSHSTV